MNKTQSKTKFRTPIVWIAMLMLAFVLAFFTACGNQTSASDSSTNSSTSDESETVETDKQTLNNGDFEFYTNSKTTYPYNSTTTKWRKTTDSDVKSAPTSSVTSGIIDTATEAFASLSDTNKPVDADGNVVNPGTPLSENDENTEVKEDGTKILMIHNKVTTAKQGTAQYFTSSTTLTLDAGDYAVISVYVKTMNLASIQGGKNYGAYIKVNNTVYSSIQPTVIKNINTEGEWKNYKIYLKPSDTAKTSFTVALGLGMGDSVNKAELCEGFAFFDNVEYTVIDKEEYDKAQAGFVASLYDEDSEIVESENAFTVNVAENKNVGVVKVDFSKKYETLDIKNADAYYKGEYNKVNPNAAGNKVLEYPAGYTTSAVKAGEEEVPANSIYMDFTAKSVGSSFSYVGASRVLNKGEYEKISFKAKVSALASSDNATVVLLDGENESSSAVFSDFTTDGEYATYNFYVTSDYDEMNYALKFSFGPTSLTEDSDIKDLPVGYAIFTDFTVTSLTEKEYDEVNTSGVNAVKATLKGDYLNSSESESADEDEDDYEDIKENYAFGISNADYATIADTYVDFKQLTSSSYKVLGNAKAIGVVNSKYADKYGQFLSGTATAALKDLEEKAETEHVQPLFISNDNGAAGVRAANVSLTAGTTYYFTIKVKTVDDAKAYIYIIDKNSSDATENEVGQIVYKVEDFKVTDNQLGSGKEETLYTVVAGSADVDYTTVTFYVRPKYDTTLAMEFWNGARDGKDNNSGIVFFDGYSTGTSSYATYEDLAAEYKDADAQFDTYVYNQGKIYSYYDYDNDEKATDDDGNEISENAEDYVVFAENKDKTIKFYRYDVLSVYNNVEKESEEESSEEETSSEDESEATDTTVGNIGWLQVTSIVIAVALIAALVAIFVRRGVEKNKKKKAKTQSYYVGYDKSTRRTVSKNGIQAPDDDGKDYDYDNPENN